MEKYRNLTSCGLEIFEDPALKTTAANYDFKYVPGDQFQRVIRTVQRDRLKQKKDSIWSEFCTRKAPTTIMSWKEEDPVSQYELRPQKKSRNLIKTKASTIKILSQSMVENNSSEQSSSNPKESYRTYKVPKVRIMTDEEIKNVVESAFKEVIDKTGNSKVVSQLLTSSRERNNPDAETMFPMSEESAKHPDKQPESSRTTTSLQSFKSSRSSTARDKEIPVTNPSSELADDFDSSLTFESENICEDPGKGSARSQISTYSNGTTNSNKKSQGDRKDDDIEEDTVSVTNDDDAGDSILETPKEEENNFPEINIIPELNCVEREEFRRILGVEEYILSSEINLNRFDETACSSSEENEEYPAVEPNVCFEMIQPLIHIRQPTPRSAIPTDNVFLCPIQSSTAVVNLIPERIESPVKKTPSTLKSSSATKLSNASSKTPRVSVIAKNTALTPRTPKGSKRSKSPRTQTDIRQYEVKQEKLTILSKIATHRGKIAQALEQIRISLDHIPEPDGNLDLKRRERRGEEFIARFARNYLYQIGRLTEEIRVTPKEDCSSLVNNDFPTKVYNLFSTLSQATVSYQKHMNSFIVNRNPKKLITLVESIYEATKMCIHKKIFDKADPSVQEVVKKTKSLKKHLSEDAESVLEIPPQKQKKSKNLKVPKNDATTSKKTKKLSMYDTLPTSLCGVKRKGYTLKGTGRSKASVRSFTLKSNCESKISLYKPDKKSTGRVTSSLKMPKKPTTNPKPSPRSSVFEENQKDDEFYIETPNIDQITTLVETVRNDDVLDEPKESEDYINEVITNLNSVRNSNVLRSADGEKDINSNIIDAVETITKQRVQQILGPLMSNLGTIISNKAGDPGVDINTILNDLIASHLSGFGNIGSAGPSAGGEDTFNRQEQNGNNFNSHETNTNSPFNVAPTVDDNNTNSERELAMQNRWRLEEPQPQAAPIPAPNAFFTGELNNNDDDFMMTSSQQPIRPTKDFVNAATSDSGALVVAATAGSRARTKPQSRTEGHDDEGGQYGASKSEVETQKVQQLRYDRNVQFTLVTENGRDYPEPIPCEQEIHSEYQNKQNITHPASKLSNNRYLVGSDPNRDNNKYRIGKLRKDRLHFIEQIADNPMYVNENFTQPWKIVTKIANKIVDETINDIERSINFGEETFVRDFIQMELES